MHVDKIYRMLDELDNDSVKRTIRNSTLSILRNKVNILFYDVTTLYFESFTSVRSPTDGGHEGRDQKQRQQKVFAARC